MVLASYLERPVRMGVPPRQERERIAGIVGHELELITLRCWMFAGLDSANPSLGEEPGEREYRLWERYSPDRIACMVDAEAALDGFRRIPHHLS
jgi:hypothetical protein